MNDPDQALLRQFRLREDIKPYIDRLTSVISSIAGLGDSYGEMIQSNGIVPVNDPCLNVYDAIERVFILLSYTKMDVSLDEVGVFGDKRSNAELLASFPSKERIYTAFSKIRKYYENPFLSKCNSTGLQQIVTRSSQSSVSENSNVILYLKALENVVTEGQFADDLQLAAAIARKYLNADKTQIASKRKLLNTGHNEQQR